LRRSPLKHGESLVELPFQQGIKEQQIQPLILAHVCANFWLQFDDENESQVDIHCSSHFKSAHLESSESATAAAAAVSDMATA